jgi:hypothetical protein
MATSASLAVQDDGRENEMRELFDLEKPEGEGRSGVDAVLTLSGEKFLFELKSTTNGSVTTVRDFGLEHIQKWKGKHWLIGRYNRSQVLQYTIYMSPEEMAPWIKEKEEYIRLDYELAKLVPSLIGNNILNRLVGQKEKYSLDEAKRIQKKQYKIEEYRSKMDLPGDGYSAQRMLSILQDRCKYLIERGSTLNNPHVPESYFEGKGVIIRESHASTLRYALQQHFAT